MAIYHFSAKIISRANGSSALASAAYRSASRLHDERLDRHHDFSNKAGVVHSEVLLPEGAPEHLADRENLWNAVEAAELRKDAQLSREVEFAIPRELDQAEGIRLAREFVEREFVAQGMIADLNVHWDVGADGEPKPHAHIMLTLRDVDESGFGKKNRDWNRTDLLDKWRERWAEHANQRLAELDIDARIDHRSLEAQGIDLEPQHKIGPAASRMAAKGLELERVDEHREIARSNGAKIIAEPRIALDAITYQQATFTTRDLAIFVHRHSEGMRGLVLSNEQRSAFDHVTKSQGLGVVIGYAGTGKSAMLGVAREAWESAGYSVRGMGLSGIAAENLESGSGIASRTIASMEHQWAEGRELLTKSDVLVIDEAGMIGTRQMERILTEAQKRGAKVVLVGDPEQLQAIEAGAAFRATAERHGSIEITEIRRQREDWQRDATRHLATERTAEAIAAYARHDRIHVAETRDGARAELIDRWDRDRSDAPDASRIILTHDRVHVLATPGLDRHAAYVALSRHRDRVDLHYGRDDFADRHALTRALSRERGKDMAADYSASEQTQAQQPARNRFAGLKLRVTPDVPELSPFERSVVRVATAAADILRGRTEGYPELPHQRVALNKAVAEMEALHPGIKRDLQNVFNVDRTMLDEAAKGRPQQAIRTMALVAEMRADPARRADQFVARWDKLRNQSQRAYVAGDVTGRKAIQSEMAGMAKTCGVDAVIDAAPLRSDLRLRPSRRPYRELDRLMKWVEQAEMTRLVYRRARAVPATSEHGCGATPWCECASLPQA